jgi:GNAT superfamily N-acetyltransferase
MREEYRREMACQIVHDSWHERGFTRSFLLKFGDDVVGYGSVGGGPRDPKHTVMEFFLRQEFRGYADSFFEKLIRISGAREVEVQTNDTLLFLMLMDRARDVVAPRILFSDGLTTTLGPVKARFRPISAAERDAVFVHRSEPVGDYAVEFAGHIVATGGFMLHYNPPYADIYMEVAEPFRRRGLGSFLVQELKRVCYESGRIPAARCASDNQASRRTLQRAGMFPCARILVGNLAA